MESNEQFSSDFRTLNKEGFKDGPEPLRWQIRMYQQLCANDVPGICDLPTGMGKTSIIHLWALALRYQELANKPRLPTRLVYVVDRRTVVDQATEIAERIQRNLPALGLPNDWLSVSTLRGKLADARDWTKDPSRPAIIIGTVDMIGSRLLFSGYRSSFKLRPLDAGLLGQDSLLVLDEAHLSEPFKKLVHAIGDQGKFQKGQGSPTRVMCMSATVSGDSSSRFNLDRTDLEGTRDSNPIVQRYEATKRLVIETPLDNRDFEAEIVKAAIGLAKDNARVVVFVQKPEVAKKLADAIRKDKRFKDAVKVLTGTMRGLERDELVTTEVLKRFLDGNERPEDKSGKQPAILVSTSAGEVGFDLNADHMVCDAAPLDSMIQRLGRVNRRGYGDATIRVFVAKPDEKKPKQKATAGKITWASATAAALDCLLLLEKSEDRARDASPKALARLRGQLKKDDLDAALSPKPQTIELTDILLDAWSMTSIAEPMPGRPPVAPWLRGIDEDEPETTLLWRAELDLVGFDELPIEDIEEWFDTHRILPHETLSIKTSQARDWIVARWNFLGDGFPGRLGERSCLIDRAGVRLLKIKTLIDELNQNQKRADSILGADIILPASFGGIREGLLEEKASLIADPPPGQSQFEQFQPPDVADEELYSLRRRYFCADGDDPETERALVGEKLADPRGYSRVTFDLPFRGDTVPRLISLVLKKQRPEYGTERQSLGCHVELVRKHAREIGDRLSLPSDVREALNLAVAWHDEGKGRDIWQRAVCKKDGEELVGKSGGPMGRIARGYRHEFGSLHALDAQAGDHAEDVFELAMHLIAAHHGRGRPHFPKGGFDPDHPEASNRIALEAVRRFARLQRVYGYWGLAWIENLLRCSDAMASTGSGGCKS